MLRLFNEAGQEIASAELGFLTPGKHNLSLPPGIAPGDYTYELEVDGGEGVSVQSELPK